MKRMFKFAAIAAAAGCLSAAAFSQNSTTTQQKTTTTYYRGTPTDMGNWTDHDRMMWFTRNLRPSEKYRLTQILDAAPANIEMLLVRCFSNVQQMSLQQVMMVGSDYSYSSTPVTTYTTTTAPTTTANNQTYIAPLSDIGYGGGRMGDQQAQEVLVMNLDEDGRIAINQWMATLVPGDRDLILKIVKDGFDTESDYYPYGVSWNRSVWSNRYWTPETYRQYNY